jgi:hypothetical protein
VLLGGKRPWYRYGSNSKALESLIKESEEKMNKAGIKKLICKGEGISIEFKECRNKLNKDVFERPLGRSSDYKFLMPSLFLCCCQEKPV